MPRNPCAPSSASAWPDSPPAPAGAGWFRRPFSRRSGRSASSRPSAPSPSSSSSPSSIPTKSSFTCPPGRRWRACRNPRTATPPSGGTSSRWKTPGTRSASGGACRSRASLTPASSIRSCAAFSTPCGPGTVSRRCCKPWRWVSVNSPATLLGRRPEARSAPLGTTLLLFLLVLWPVASSAKDDWLPITPEELALKDNPASPGSSAMILYREMHTDDVKSFETHYYRIKIFTEEGKKYGDIQVHYWKGRGQVKDLKARVVQPNGTAVEFTGVVYDKVVAKYRDVRYMAKTFTLPDVQVGGIIEYQYRLQFDSMRLYDTRWTIQRELAIRRARLSIRPYSGGLTSLRWVMYHMPPGKKLEAQADDTYLLELENAPALTEEKYMPPEDWLKMRIEFFYSSGLPLGPDFFWRRVVTEMNEGVDKFVDKRKELEREVAQVVLPGARR